MPIEEGRLQPVIVSHDPNWFGRITGLALSLKLPSTGPVRIQGVTAQTLSAGAVLGEQAREWLSLELWSASSINTVVGGANLPELPLPALLGLAAALATATTLLLARWRPAWLGARLPAALAIMFVAAWFALDARWQWNLAQQVRATRDQYAGKSWHEKHIASDDGPLFRVHREGASDTPPTSRARLHLCRLALFAWPRCLSPLPIQRVLRPVRQHNRSYGVAATRRLRGRLPAPGCSTTPRSSVFAGMAIHRSRRTCCWSTPALHYSGSVEWTSSRFSPDYCSHGSREFPCCLRCAATGVRSRRPAKLRGWQVSVTWRALSCLHCGCERYHSPACASELCRSHCHS